MMPPSCYPRIRLIRPLHFLIAPMRCESLHLVSLCMTAAILLISSRCHALQVSPPCVTTVPLRCRVVQCCCAAELVHPWRRHATQAACDGLLGCYSVCCSFACMETMTRTSMKLQHPVVDWPWILECQ